MFLIRQGTQECLHPCDEILSLCWHSYLVKNSLPNIETEPLNCKFNMTQDLGFCCRSDGGNSSFFPSSV